MRITPAIVATALFASAGQAQDMGPDIKSPDVSSHPSHTPQDGTAGSFKLASCVTNGALTGHHFANEFAAQFYRLGVKIGCLLLSKQERQDIDSSLEFTITELQRAIAIYILANGPPYDIPKIDGDLGPETSKYFIQVAYHAGYTEIFNDSYGPENPMPIGLARFLQEIKSHAQKRFEEVQQKFMKEKQTADDIGETLEELTKEIEKQQVAPEDTFPFQRHPLCDGWTRQHKYPCAEDASLQGHQELPVARLG